MDSQKPSLCFVAHNAYGAVACIDSGHIGGIERQTSLMARWFAARGYLTSMVTWDEGQSNGVEISGVRVFKMCRRDTGCKGVRFLYPRWTSLNAAMQRADADVYYYNCGDLGLGQMVMWCRRHGRKSVYSVASDPNCDPKLPILKPWRERLLYKYGLQHADRIIVQTQHQRQMLWEGFGIDSTVISMPCEGFPLTELPTRNSYQESSSHVLWVGRISDEKRLEWLLDVAQRYPEIHFDVVGACNANSEYASMLTMRAARIPNVEMHGRILHKEMAGYYRRCHVLCCTSAYEGFPNTFLEAWSLGIPVVSTFDPDGVISRHNLGWTAESVDGLADALLAATTDVEQWRTAAESARDYYLKNHALDSSMSRFARVVEDLCRQ